MLFLCIEELKKCKKALFDEENDHLTTLISGFEEIIETYSMVERNAKSHVTDLEGSAHVAWHVATSE